LIFPSQILAELAGGWALFLGRVVLVLTVDWGGVAIGAVCLALFAILAHSFFGWLYPRVRWPDDGSVWKAKWTASLVAVVVLMFAAGISAAGIAHQVGWLLTSHEPLIESSFSGLIGRVQSSNNLRQMGLAILNYESEHGTMPPAATLDPEGRLLHGWQARLLPYMEPTALYNNINFNVPWDAPENSTAIRTRVNVYLNPGIRFDHKVPGPAPSHYAANAWLLGGDSLRKSKEIPDGASNTILAGEAPDQFKPWGHPANWRDPARGINKAPDGFGGPHRGGANFLFADGSARFIKDTVDTKVFRSLGTPNGGEVINADRY
jgi:prepilin-type processing-associated H-X9-DG protein